MLAKLTLPSMICVVVVVLDSIVAVTEAWAPLLEDNVYIRTDIVGSPNPGPRSWADSYSDGGSCYCATTYDHNLAPVVVDTPLGPMTVKEVCVLLGEGPTGSSNGRPLYNDIQCGNGPSVVDDEVACPGRTEYGQEGCKYIGPKWNFTPHLPPSPTTTTKTPVRTPIIAPVKPPTKAPTKKPTRKPTKAPVKTPIIAPIQPPAKAPTKKPTRAPVKASIAPPTLPITNTTACKIEQIDLWDTIAKKVNQTSVVNGIKICNTMEFTFDAVTTSACIGSNVKFVLVGPNSYRYVKNEGQPPYCLYGNSGSTLYGKSIPTLGRYNVSVIPNQRTDWAKTISFQIVGC